MAVQYSIQKMVSDGTLSTIALGIQYLQRNDIYMRIAGEETPQSGASSGYTWSFIDNTTLKILPVVPNGIEVVVYRRTDVDLMYNIYSQNAQFDEDTIDENNQQLLYIAQEYLEQGIPGAGIQAIELVSEDDFNLYYRVLRTDGSYTDNFTMPKSAVGYTRVGDFTAGCTVTARNQAVLEVGGSAYVWKGALPKVVPPSSTPHGTGGISPYGDWVDVGDASVRSDINKGIEQESVCYIESWGNDTTAKVNSTVYPFNTISAAMAATAGPTKLCIGTGSFEWIAALRDYLTVEGSGEPSVSEDQLSMSGGTILYTSGTGGFPGGVGFMRGITFRNLGILAKGKTDGLIIAAPAGSGTGSGITIENVVTLADQTSYHSCLLENIENLYVNNLTTYGGVSGLAVKAVNFTVSNLKHYDASGAYLTLRESPYAACRNGVVNNVVGVNKLRTAATSAGVQFLNNEEGCEMSGVQVNNVVVSGVTSGVFFDNQTNTKSMTDVTVSNPTVYGSDDFAITVNGNAKSIRVLSPTVYNCTAALKLSVASGSAPMDCEIKDINLIAGAKSVFRPILNEGVRTSISGVKVNQLGKDIFNPVIENPGADLVISGVQYYGSIVTDTGSGYHSVVEGEGLKGVASGPSEACTVTATKRFDGSLRVSMRNALISSASTVVTLPANMSFKAGNPATPAQLRQNFSVNISGYLNAPTPTVVDMKLIAFPLSPNSFQVNILADPFFISNGVVISCDLEGDWK